MTDEMDDPSRPSHGRGGAGLVAVLALLLAYPLSLGPVAYMGAKGWLPAQPPPWFTRVYGPLVWTARKVPPAGQVLQAYLNWWIELAK